MQLVNHNTNGTTTAYFPGYDANGNLASLTREDGTLAAIYEYSPFGELLRKETPDPAVADQPFRFSSKYTDDESGLVYYGARYYSPGLGRFLNRDPIEEGGGLNLYGFCGNDGINHWDYLGHSWLSKALNKLGHWISEHKREILFVASVAIGITTGIYVSGLVKSALIDSAVQASITAGVTNTFALSTTIMTTAASTTTGIIAGAVGGAAGGFVSGAITTGSLHGALQGAAIGGVTGGLMSYVNAKFPSWAKTAPSTPAKGMGWFTGERVGVEFERLASSALVRGAAAKASGGSFRKAALRDLELGGLDWAVDVAVEARYNFEVRNNPTTLSYDKNQLAGC